MKTPVVLGRFAAQLPTSGTVRRRAEGRWMWAKLGGGSPVLATAILLVLALPVVAQAAEATPQGPAQPAEDSGTATEPSPEGDGPVGEGGSGEGEDRTVARRMAEEGARLFEQGGYEPARDLFKRAYSLYPAPTLALWEARALEKLGRLVEAEERYAAVERYELQPDDPDAYQAAVRDASAEIEKLRKRIPTVTITLSGVSSKHQDIQVRIDGRLVKPALLGFPKPVDPGTRTITLWVDGKKRLSTEVTLKEGDRKPVELQLAEVARKRTLPPPPRRQPVQPDRPSQAEEDTQGSDMWRTLGSVGLGIGVAGLATGVVSGLMATSQHETLEANCKDGSCPRSYWDDLDSFHMYRDVSTVGYIVGGLGLAAGVTLLIVAPDAPPSETSAGSLELRLAPNMTSLAGTF